MSEEERNGEFKATPPPTHNPTQKREKEIYLGSYWNNQTKLT